MKKKTLPLFWIILSALLGVFFIFSAWTKTTPNLQYFEFTIHSQIGVSDFLSAVAARFFVGLEAALGLMMLISIFGRKKWVLKVCLALLVLFSVHLILLWINRGSEVDCGCMGSVVKMNPWVSLIKNVVLMALIGLLLRFAPEETNGYNHILSIIVIIIIIATPFVIYPIGVAQIPVSKLYSANQPEKPHEIIGNGKHIVCFMSLTCPHCRDAATLIEEISLKYPEIPFYFFFPHEDNDTLQHMKLKDFMQQTKAIQIPHSFILQKTFVDMVKAAGEDGVPTMLWLKDSSIARKMEVPDLEDTALIAKEMKVWLRQKQ